MARKETKAKRAPSGYIFDCESLPIPPGTKSRARLWRGAGPEPNPRPVWWWLFAGTTVLALSAGILIGRFLLP
jgi:hypothetical protein